MIDLVFTNDAGVLLTNQRGAVFVPQVQSLTVTRKANDIGTLTLTLDEPVDERILRRDSMVQVWIAPQGAVRRLWRVYFIRRWRWETRGKTTTVEIGGVDTNDLLRRRIVTAAPQIPGGRVRDDECDDAMRRVVRQEQEFSWGWPYWMQDDYGRFSTPSRNTRKYPYFSVEADIGFGKWDAGINDISGRKLLEPGGGGVLADISEANVRRGGKRLFFDVDVAGVGTNSISFCFRVYNGLIGTDRTRSGMQFSLEQGNISEIMLEYDYTREENNLYYGTIARLPDGQSFCKQMYDGTQIDASLWNRCEAYIGNVDYGTAVQELRRRAGKCRLVAKLLSTPSCQLGKDWDFGDRIRIGYRGMVFDAIITSVVIQVSSSGTEIYARVDSEV